jgi:hypothetical protein
MSSLGYEIKAKTLAGWQSKNVVFGARSRVFGGVCFEVFYPPIYPKVQDFGVPKFIYF